MLGWRIKTSVLNAASGKRLEKVVARERFELSSAGPEPADVGFKSLMGVNLGFKGEKAISISPEETESLIKNFIQHCRIDERLEPRVCKDYRNTALRFLRFSNGEISRGTVRAYLSKYLERAPKTYNNQLDGLRAFIKRFLGAAEIMEGFKKAPQNHNFDFTLPTGEQLRRAFSALTDDRERAIFLFYASTGLRTMEALSLNRFRDIDFKMRAVKAKHETRTKKAGVTFYNEECEFYLKKYLKSRTDDSERLFRIGWREFLRIWRKASEAAGIKITPQVLRKWHSTMLGN